MTARLPTPTSDLERRLRAYTPTECDEVTWSAIAPSAIPLAARAGAPKEQRARLDLHALAKAAGHLAAAGRPVSIDELVADTTQVSLDVAMKAAGQAEGTRENTRGRLRRLQAVHHGVPWRKDRKVDGAAAGELPTYGEVRRVLDVLPGAASTAGGAALAAAIGAARASRRGELTTWPSDADWTLARRHAHRRGVTVTKAGLAALAVYEVLAEPRPIADLARDYQLTRRNMDLALTAVADLPTTPDAISRALMRG